MERTQGQKIQRRRILILNFGKIRRGEGKLTKVLERLIRSQKNHDLSYQKGNARGKHSEVLK